MLEVIKQHDMPLDRIVHVEIMATDTIPADLPQMMEFKSKADRIIKERYGIEVEHLHGKYTYDGYFYRHRTENAKFNPGGENGFPRIKGAWCNSMLKMEPLRRVERGNFVYIGIAADEPNRFHNFTECKISPLVEWDVTEADARKICEELNLLSPIYTQAARGGCWFCHYQGVRQLRLLRKQYPEYWAQLLRWDTDSVPTFKADGHTVHDFDRRFQAEDDGLIYSDDKVFRWDMLSRELNYRWF